MHFQRQNELILNFVTRQQQCISPITITALKIFEKTLGKSPSLSINVKLQNHRPFLQVNPRFEKFDTMNLFTAPISCIFLITLYLLFNSAEPLTAIQIAQVIIIICALTIFVFGGVTRHILRTNSEFITQSNALWQCNTTEFSKHIEGSSFSANGKSFDFAGIMLFLLIISLNILGIPGYILLCYVGMDPIQATLHQCLNVSPNYLTFTLSSIICVLLFMFICVREMYVLAFSAILLLVRLKAELISLDSYTLLKSKFVSRRYVLLRRQHNRLEKVLSLVTACVIVFCQIIHCALLWMVCICWRIIPLYMSAGCLVIFTVSLVGLYFALDMQGGCQVCSKHLDGFHVYGIQGGVDGHLSRIWKCQLPLRIYCGRQFVVGKDAFINYLDVFSSNLTNAVVLIKI